jgi:hypothetical protein
VGAQIGALGEVVAQESVGRSYVCQAAAGAWGTVVAAGVVAACIRR